VSSRLSPITRITPQALLTATLSVRTSGIGFAELTRDTADFLREAKAADGALTVFLRHTSASLTIQENADPDVQTDLTDALNRLAPQHAGYIHDTEGPDDMPAHIKAMLTGVSLTIPVKDGKAALGTWQGIYLIEHRRAPHTREVVLQFIGACRE
jgi:secondary thiamine-phosphate synthase enzyme